MVSNFVVRKCKYNHFSRRIDVEVTFSVRWMNVDARTVQRGIFNSSFTYINADPCAARSLCNEHVLWHRCVKDTNWFLLAYKSSQPK